MQGFSIGPFVVPSNVLAVLIAAVVAAIVGRLVGRMNRTTIGNVLMDMGLAGFVAARLVFVVLWFDRYRDSLFGWLDVRDGGFTVWAGVLSAALVGAWHARRRPQLRKPLTAGLCAGVSIWLLSPGLFQFGNGVPLQSLPLATLAPLDAARGAASTPASGRPTVVNLWATWCPPCRRELPVLAAAQKERPDIRFVFVDQGEQAEVIRAYLAEQKLAPQGVVLDPAGTVGKASGSFGLPTTLFYDARGRLVTMHVGGLSSATLAATLQDIPRAASAASSP